MSARILVVDDDRAFRLSTAALLRAHHYQLMLVDFRMPGLDSVRLVETLRVWGEVVPILMVSGFGTIETAVRALQSGTDDYLQKPGEPDVLLARVSDLLSRRPTSLGSTPDGHGIVGRSSAMRGVLDAIVRVALTQATVLITGKRKRGKSSSQRRCITHLPVVSVRSSL